MMDRMFAFHGVDSKVGTTMLAQSVAEMITDQRKELKVILLHLNGRSGTEYVTQVGESIEGIKMYLDNKVLSTRELINSCRRTENFYLLGGVESIGQSRHYFPEAASYLLDSLNEEFDLIIVDTGNDLDNGLAIGALEQIQNRFCILTQQESIIRRYEKSKDFYAQLGFSFAHTVINKYSEQDPYQTEYIARRLGLPLNEVLKVEATGYDRQAEMEYRTMISYHNEGYNRDIVRIANLLLTKCSLEPIDSKRKKRWKPFF
jgi:MinD-like ATPase involved in chromosome partitioning or flagellar assembly